MEPSAAVMRLAEGQHGVLTRFQATSLGMSSHAIRHRLADGQWHRLYTGVYALGGAPRSWEQRVMAACLAAGPRAAASHRAAATLWSIPGGKGLIEITVVGRRRVTLPGPVVYRSVRLDSADVGRIARIPVTSLPRTVIDLASVLDRDSLQAVLDHVLAERLLTVGHLRLFLERLGRQGRRGAGVLADLLAQVAVPLRVPQSRFELLLLRALRAAGLPDPEIQYRVDLPGDRSAYLDFAYPEHLLAIEADSFRHHSTLSGWSRDRTRNNALVVTGWRVLPVTYDDLVGSPESVALQIRNALAAFGEAGSRRAGGLEALGGRAAQMFETSK